MNEIICFLALSTGFLFRKKLAGIRKVLANFINFLLIPIVIIFNVINLSSSKAFVSLWMICLLTFLAFTASRFSKDKIKILCFSYVNIGWFGIPITHLFFDDAAVTFIIYAYIGNSLFGNVLAALLLKSRNDQSFLTLLKTVVFSPPVISILLCIPLFFFKDWINSHTNFVYQYSKQIMSFAGLFILGSWLNISEITRKYFFLSLLKASAKSILILLFSIIFVFLGKTYDNSLIYNNISIIILISLLPPAANVVILETSYLNSGKSAKIITIETIISIVLVAIFLLVYKLVF